MPTQTKPGLYLSQLQLQINGTDAPQELMNDVLEVIVEESLHLPSMFTLLINNTYLSGSNANTPWRYDNYFKIGDKIKIGFSNSTTLDKDFKHYDKEYLIESEVTALEAYFQETSDAHILIRGYDVSHRLHRGRYNRSFLNQTDSDIVRKVASEVSIQLGKIEESGETHEYIFQENQTNMEFLQKRAALIGFLLYIQDNKLHFHKPEKDASLNLKWLIDINSFYPRVTTAQQVNNVEVRCWDYTQKKLITSTANSETVITETGSGKGSSTSTDFNLSNQPPKMIVVDQPVYNPKDAEMMAQALCNELGGEFVHADGKANGNPEIRAGKVIKLEGMGDRYNGEYHITETRHTYKNLVYTTEFSVRGLRDRSLLKTLSPPTHLQPGQTFLVGIVTDNNDPQGMGRVKVKFPTLTEEHSSYWARVVGLGAANNRGFYCLPEIDDEVLVGFEHGNIHRPFIIGGVWNGKDKTPEKVEDTINKGKVRLRTIRTRTGHTVEFVEDDGGGSNENNSKDGIYIYTSGGHHIRLNDQDSSPDDQFIEIETSGGHKVRLDDATTAQGIRITSSGGHQVHLNDKPLQSIEVQTTSGQNLTLNDEVMIVTLQTTGMISIQAGADVNINATGAVSVEASEVNISSLAITMEASEINMMAASISMEGFVTANAIPVV
ncbi:MULTISPECIES: VgrG-related protein [Nostoc]|uniref:VgrG-related protein n=1 Tax=Nostoc paludosum FACHB-159 TaxID=2692908 RepID=A0ABR8KDY0_9NOSO|nr:MULTISPECIES: VgrG-related protein [Nostoc]MBD2681286.1 VgrG-related protein [Nostoc sp. FACHB-857]MBD2737765.1 VgrG-related protein [Nostoc paludosum FACHB-159]